MWRIPVWKRLWNFINQQTDDLEKNFNRLIEGVNENFRKRNISMLEFVDYYESYKETSLQLYETRKDVFLAMENLNTVVGRNIFNY